MKPTTIEFTFDDSKLDAINIFLSDKNSSLSDELDHFMDSLYKKHVPQSVRDFIEKKEAEDAKTASSRKTNRKKPNTECGAVSGTVEDGGGITRPNAEKPV